MTNVTKGDNSQVRVIILFVIFLLVSAASLVTITSQQNQVVSFSAAQTQIIKPTPVPHYSLPPCYIPYNIFGISNSSNNNSNIVTKPTATPTPTIGPTIGVKRYGYGDVNQNGIIDVVDAQLILRYDAGLYNLSPLQLEAADVDGKPNIISRKEDVNVTDALKILRYNAGIDKTFPVCGNVIPTTPTPIPKPRISPTPRLTPPLISPWSVSPYPTKTK